MTCVVFWDLLYIYIYIMGQLQGGVKKEKIKEKKESDARS